MRWLHYTSILLCLALFSFGCSPKLSQLNTSFQAVSIPSDSTDKQVRQWLLPYQIGLDSIMTAALVLNAQTMTKEQPESLLGNMMADITFKTAEDLGMKPDFAILNYGGIRTSALDSGMLTVGDAYKLMPFDNIIVVLEIPGKVVNQLLNHTAQWGGWPVKGIQAKISPTQKRVAGPIYIGGQILEEDRIYRLATSDYIANGGDQCSFLQTLPQMSTAVLLREAIIQEWSDLGQKGKVLISVKENRISYVE